MDEGADPPRVVFESLAAAEAAVGTTSVGAPFVVTQARIDAFAAATDDAQWIHVDAGRARRESPFGETIAHGFLTLSLLTTLLERSVSFPFARASINYGLDRVRFVAPLRAGSTIRASATLASCERTERGARLVWDVRIDVPETPKPVLVASWTVLLLARPPRTDPSDPSAMGTTRPI